MTQPWHPILKMACSSLSVTSPTPARSLDWLSAWKKLTSWPRKNGLRRILCIQWQDKVPNTEVLECAGMRSMSAILSEKRLRWLGHIRRMGPGRIPRDLFNGELAEGSRLIGRPRLRYKDICKKDMKLSDINIGTWERRAEDRSAWHFVVRQVVQKAEETRIKNLATKRVKRKEKQLQPQLASSSFIIIVHLQKMQQRLPFKYWAL